MVSIPLINCTYSHEDMQDVLLLLQKLDTIANIFKRYRHLPAHRLITGKKGWDTMNRDRQLIVNLEVTVPRLILPIPSLDLSETSDEAEQVRLSSIDAQETAVQ